MRTKVCFKCKTEKPIEDFSICKPMADGYLGKCKPCAAADTRAWYARTRPARDSYEAVRSKRPDRKANTAKYGRVSRGRSPEKRAARIAVGNAVRDGRLRRMPCEICGSLRVQAHHDDYSKPLSVRWLCFKHHREVGHGQLVTAREED